MKWINFAKVLIFLRKILEKIFIVGKPENYPEEIIKNGECRTM